MSTHRDTSAEIGIIGGSGLYDLGLLDHPRRVRITTPFGEPSDDIVLGTLAGRRVAFLPRHGTGHRLSPSEIPVRANLYALRELGVREVFGVSAVGSLSERYAPGHLVVPNQVVDRTKGVRPASFFGDGVVAHVSLADPFCTRLQGPLVEAARAERGVVIHEGATYCCIEGPQFSTRAESELYRSWGMGIIGMTAVPEVGLAREAGLCYVGLSLVTDYDCWHHSEEPVTAETVAQVMHRNVESAGRVLTRAVGGLTGPAPDCACRHALDSAVLTAADAIPDAGRRLLESLTAERVTAATG
jgi:5'-methylthioadenosine phosphorylase